MNTKNQTTHIRIRGYGSGGAVQGMLTTGVITQSTGLAPASDDKVLPTEM